MRTFFFLLGWVFSFFILLSIKFNHITTYFVGIRDGSDIFYFRFIIIINIIIFLLSKFIIKENGFKIKNTWLWSIGFLHIIVLFSLFDELHNYLLYTTFKGISPLIVFNFDIGIDINNMNEFKKNSEFIEWQTHFSFIDRLYALLPISFSFYYIYLPVKMIFSQCCRKF